MRFSNENNHAASGAPHDSVDVAISDRSQMLSIRPKFTPSAHDAVTVANNATPRQLQLEWRLHQGAS